MLPVPGGEIADSGEGNQRGEIPVTPRALDEKRRRVALHDEFGAHDGAHARTARFTDEADHTAQIGGIGDADSRIPQPGGTLNQCLGRDRAVTKGESGMGAKLDEIRVHAPSVSPLRHPA